MNSRPRPAHLCFRAPKRLAAGIPCLPMVVTDGIDQ
jgi:hypothetical protein